MEDKSETYYSIISLLRDCASELPWLNMTKQQEGLDKFLKSREKRIKELQAFIDKQKSAK